MNGTWGSARAAGQRVKVTEATDPVETRSMPSWSWVPDPMEMPCPTCLVAADEGFDGPDTGGPWAEPACCPTCGVVSVEWGLAVATDAALRELLGLERLLVAIDELA